MESNLNYGAMGDGGKLKSNLNYGVNGNEIYNVDREAAVREAADRELGTRIAKQETETSDLKNTDVWLRRAIGIPIIISGPLYGADFRKYEPGTEYVVSIYADPADNVEDEAVCFTDHVLAAYTGDTAYYHNTGDTVRIGHTYSFIKYSEPEREDIEPYTDGEVAFKEIGTFDYLNGKKADKVHTHKKADITDFPETMPIADGSITAEKLADNSVTEKKLSRRVWEKISNPLKPIPVTGYSFTFAAIEVMDAEFTPDYGEIMYIKDNPWGGFDTIIGLDGWTWYALPGSVVNEGESAIIVFKTRPTDEAPTSGEFEVITTNVPIDTELSESSSNLVRNSVIANAFEQKADKSHMHTAADITDLPTELPPTDGSVTMEKLSDDVKNAIAMGGGGSVTVDQISMEITVPQSDWINESDPDGYDYRIDISAPSITSEQEPEVTFHKSSLLTASKAGICAEAETTDGALRLWARHKPDADMTARVRLMIPTQGGGDAYVLPTATAERLGGVKIGENITVQPDGTISSSGRLDPSQVATDEDIKNMIENARNQKD